jgi:prepilin-type N-terminal cleavage/methylation domain-containing protein
MSHSDSPARRHRRHLVSQSGLTLVEVLVSVALLGVGLLPVAYMQSSGTRSGMTSYGVVTASALAVELNDKLRNIPYSDPRLAQTSDYVAPDVTLSPASPLASDGSYWAACAPNQSGGTATCGYTRTLRITNNTPIANAKRIDVRVSWSQYGTTQSYILSTIKAVGS